MLDKEINKGLNYLEKVQQRDGSFLSLSSPDRNNFKKSLIFHSVFSTALVLSSLSVLKETPQIKKIKQRAADFLLSQKSEFWSFNYWARNSKEFKKIPYPDDLDDTFCALSALYLYDKNLIGGEVMAQVIEVLGALEIKEGGPYRTWLVPEESAEVWKDVDVAVNSNVGYFLSLQEISLPNINKFIQKSIKEEKVSSPYYPEIFPIIYFISRFYKRADIKKLVESANKKLNPMDTALWLNAGFNLKLGENKDEKINYLTENQQTDGSWLPYPFYTGVNPKLDKTYYAGSSALTTAFCLEAMGKFLQRNEVVEITQNPKSLEEMSGIFDEVIKRARERFLRLDIDLSKEAIKILEHVLIRDTKRQIVLTPCFFSQSLGQKISKEVLIKLGMVNLYGWVAYTIYDNFLDEEGDIKTLSVANLCLRELTLIYNELLPKKSGFQKLFNQIMDELEGANTWEVSNCRLGEKAWKDFEIPDYRNLEKVYQKSFGHALGPLAILYSLGFKSDSVEIKLLVEFFRSYLIAKQLNDDAHDFEDDFKRGQVSPVCALVLKKIRNKKVRISKSLFREVFWKEVAVEVCELMLEKCKKARNCLEKNLVIKDKNLLESLIIDIENSANKALAERKEILKFLGSYKGN